MAASMSFCISRIFRSTLKKHLTNRWFSSIPAGSNLPGLPLGERELYHGIVPTHSSITLSKLLNSAPRCVYCGFDPTADSLHIGNLLALNALIHCQRAGHQVIALIGGATALIGDPSGKSAERPSLSIEDVESNVKGLEASISRVFTNHERYLWKKQKQLKPPRILNNADWYKDIKLVQFLSTAGRHFRMQKLLSRESVRSRLVSQEGMSFQEFSYQVFQAYDYYYLHKQHQCILQLGGSDQLGNLSTGHDFVKRTTGTDVYGVTVPLLTTSSGSKLGKTAGNAVWLNNDRTSPFDMYQYFIRLKDSDVEKHLKMLTFLTLPEVENVITQHRSNPKKRSAQRVLAEQVLLLVHGQAGLDEALRLTDALYNSSPTTLGALAPAEFDALFQGAQTHEVVLQADTTVLDLVEKIQCIPPGENAVKIINEGGLYINQQQMRNTQALIRKGDHILQNNITLVRIGKKKYSIVKWIS